MIKFIFLNCFIVIYTLIICFIILFFLPFDRNGRLIHFYCAVPWAKVILWVCGVKVRAGGQENVEAGVPRIYMTNHQSYFDIFALLAYVQVDFKFIMKQELMRIPALGFAMRRAGYIGIERGNPKEAIKSMNTAAEKMKAGASVLIFPEGTRSIDGRLQPFKKGGFIMAFKSGCDIVPVAIADSYRIVPKGRLKINKGSFEVNIGKAISVKDYRKKDIAQLMDKVREAISSQMAESRNNQETQKQAP
ncbi:MAG: 1-acyl-sn-glycerol-3-phosphate acyltransferase [Desulfobacterales bacterium]|nr:1-acyl-sn-glycerol-3-phosphate acyltransferase [Desulfobacterales bacterium]